MYKSSVSPLTEVFLHCARILPSPSFARATALCSPIGLDPLGLIAPGTDKPVSQVSWSADAGAAHRDGIWPRGSVPSAAGYFPDGSVGKASAGRRRVWAPAPGSGL